MSEVTNKIEYIVVFISEFAKRCSLTNAEAYRYIKHFGGIEMLRDNYEVMHTLDFSQTVSDMVFYCKRKGGKLC